MALQIDDYKIVSGSGDNTVRVWPIEGSEPVSCIALSTCPSPLSTGTPQGRWANTAPRHRHTQRTRRGVSSLMVRRSSPARGESTATYASFASTRLVPQASPNWPSPRSPNSLLRSPPPPNYTKFDFPNNVCHSFFLKLLALQPIFFGRKSSFPFFSFWA